MLETAETRERAVLVGVDRGSVEWPLEDSLDELERLADTAGADTVARLSQRLTSPNPRTFIGTGKVREVADAIRDTSADVVIFDDELTPSQQANLERELGRDVKVIDRTALILDIFALSATSREGRLEVRLAQNLYLYPRLRGMWAHLASNRMGGGVGSRFGEGESQLEVDRRLVRKRITRLRRELAQLATTRGTQRKERATSGIFRVALAGYTNAGKSSLLNALCGSCESAAENRLFATLDSTTRRIELDGGVPVTVTDTVGFIQKLPHTLVEAFRSTLDEVRDADLVVIVCDAASPMRDSQLASVRDVLDEIGAAEVPSIIVDNKIDLVDAAGRARLAASPESPQLISAATGEGIDGLAAAISERALESSTHLRVLVPYAQGSLVELAHASCSVVSEEYAADGVQLELLCPRPLVHRFAPFAL